MSVKVTYPMGVYKDGAYLMRPLLVLNGKPVRYERMRVETESVVEDFFELPRPIATVRHHRLTLDSPPATRDGPFERVVYRCREAQVDTHKSGRYLLCAPNAVVESREWLPPTTVPGWTDPFRVL